MSLKDKLHLQIDYFQYIIFLALANESKESAVLAYQKQYAESKELSPKAVAFQSVALLYKEETPVILPVENKMSAETSPYQLTGTVIFYPDRQCGFINNTIRNESFSLHRRRNRK
ncbi:MAG: hypothetical protein LBT05_11295 [Planctomycetaceae bacterium]|nr:hypothetical protein [Planctomycetaceae bacterium]